MLQQLHHPALMGDCPHWHPARHCSDYCNLLV